MQIWATVWLTAFVQMVWEQILAVLLTVSFEWSKSIMVSVSTLKDFAMTTIYLLTNALYVYGSNPFLEPSEMPRKI